MNEGHSAFLALERIRQLDGASRHLDFDEAREAVAAGTVFTTHTPVAAGHDAFPPGLVERLPGRLLRELGHRRATSSWRWAGSTRATRASRSR